MVKPVAYGSSQTWGQIGATAACATATAMLDLHLQLALELTAMLDPLSEARDRTHILIDTGSGI